MNRPASSDVTFGGAGNASSDRSVPGEMTIGEVLTHLRPDFPDVTISKIRFLESEGLIEPRRSPSGYRKFGTDDIARLRYVLTAQRDHYLPLRVIKDHLDAIDRGLEPPPVGLPGPRVPVGTGEAPAPPYVRREDPGAPLRLSRAELLEASGLTAERAAELAEAGLLAPGEEGYYDADALTIARAVAELSSHGLEIRHLRPLKTAADRVAGLVEQLVSPMLGSRPDRASEIADAVATASVRLQAALVRVGLRPLARR